MNIIGKWKIAEAGLGGKLLASDTFNDMILDLDETRSLSCATIPEVKAIQPNLKLLKTLCFIWCDTSILNLLVLISSRQRDNNC
jgi:hypothetical protein